MRCDASRAMWQKACDELYSVFPTYWSVGGIFSLDKELFVEIVSLGNIVFRGIESDCISLVLPLFLGFFLNKSPQRLKS